MTVKPGPYDLTSTRLILGPQGNATPKPVTPDFYAELDREFSDFSGHVLISRHEFDEPWEGWEMHPRGDEFTYLLFGDVDFVLREGDRETIVRVNEERSYLLVPQGAWHTARPRKPTAMLFVTPGEGTLNADAPGDT